MKMLLIRMSRTRNVNNIPDRIDAVLQEAKTESGSGQPQDNLQISEE